MDSHVISTIYSDGQYAGWPTIARSPLTGRIFVVFSGGRLDHVCPFGKVMMITSDDNGKTWSQGRVLYDGPLDDRDAGVLVTSKGTVLVNWFNSLAAAIWFRSNSVDFTKYSPEAQQRWQKTVERITDKCVAEELGCWIIRSEDNGETFCGKVPSIANSPHGPTELSDGRLLYIGKLRDEIQGFRDAPDGAPHSCKIGVSESRDDGKTWQLLCGELPVAEGQVAEEYHEFHAVQAEDGRIIAQIRNHNKSYEGETLQMESADGGRSWSVPKSINVWGTPSHLLKLSDGRLMMSYSHRREPMGNFARISNDNGMSWSTPFIFGPTRPVDMGYPASIELPDRTILSIWYEQIPGRSQAVIRMARWTPFIPG
jgi:hypothetical protein